MYLLCLYQLLCACAPKSLLKCFFSWSLLLPLILCDFAIFLQILYKNTTGWIVRYSNAILNRYSLTIPYLTKITTIKFDHHLWISIYWFCFGMAKTILILKYSNFECLNCSVFVPPLYNPMQIRIIAYSFNIENTIRNTLAHCLKS